MKILSRVCVEFKDRTGAVIYRVGPADRLVYKDDAPEAIREDPIFQMLLADGSLEVIETVEQRKKLESDPVAGTDATGKKEKPDPQADTAAKPETKPAKSAK